MNPKPTVNEIYEAEAAKGRAIRAANEKRYAETRAAQLKPPPPTPAQTAAEFAGLRKQSDRLAADIASVVTAVAKNPAPVSVVPTAATPAEIHDAVVALRKKNPKLSYRDAVVRVTK
jgi:hypothetical protein